MIQFHYGGDGIDPTKIETQGLSICKLANQDIEDQFGMKQVDWSKVLKHGTIRDADAELITEYVNNLLFDQRCRWRKSFRRRFATPMWSSSPHMSTISSLTNDEGGGSLSEEVAAFRQCLRTCQFQAVSSHMFILLCDCPKLGQWIQLRGRIAVILQS